VKLATLALALAIVAAPAQADDEWLTWTAARAQAIGKVAYTTRRVRPLLGRVHAHAPGRLDAVPSSAIITPVGECSNSIFR
jgi:hypothetical protein